MFCWLSILCNCCSLMSCVLFLLVICGRSMVCRLKWWIGWRWLGVFLVSSRYWWLLMSRKFVVLVWFILLIFCVYCVWSWGWRCLLCFWWVLISCSIWIFGSIGRNYLSMCICVWFFGLVLCWLMCMCCWLCVMNLSGVVLCCKRFVVLCMDMVIWFLGWWLIFCWLKFVFSCNVVFDLICWFWVGC